MLSWLQEFGVLLISDAVALCEDGCPPTNCEYEHDHEHEHECVISSSASHISRPQQIAPKRWQVVDEKEDREKGRDIAAIWWSRRLRRA